MNYSLSRVKRSVRCTYEAGFSLVELAIVFTAIGLSIAATAQYGTIYIQHERYEKVNERITMSKTALQEFYALRGRYPCPADPTLAPTDTNFGREQCRANINLPCPGLPGGIKCVTAGARDADNDGNPDIVRIGSIPFKDVRDAIVDTPFVAQHAEDPYNIKLTYAVSEKMTATSYSVLNPANPHLGAIDVRDENQIQIIDPPSSAHFVVLSHGDNHLGGYNTQGPRFSLCVTGLVSDPPDTEPAAGLNVVGIAPEKENCDGNDAIFVAGRRSLAEGSNYNDDTATFVSSGLIQHWAYSLASASTTKIYNTNMGNVGVGVEDPASKLHVKNSISAENKIGAVKYCDQSASPSCVKPEKIGGSGSSCPAGKTAIGIKENELICASITFPKPSGTCAAGTYLVGISSSGNIECQTY